MTHRNHTTAEQRKADRIASKRRAKQDRQNRETLAEFMKIYRGCATPDEKSALCDALATKLEDM